MANEGPLWVRLLHTIKTRAYPITLTPPVVQPGSQWSTVPAAETFKESAK